MESGNKDLVRRFIQEVVNTGNTGQIGEYLADNYTEVFDNIRYPIGLEGARAHIAGVRATYPDLLLDIDFQIAEGEWVATNYTMTGTHAGEWIGIAPTGKKIRCTGVNLDRVVDGKIVEHGGAANLLGALMDIGAVLPNIKS